MNADKLEIIKFQLRTIVNEVKTLVSIIFDLDVLEENLDFDPIDFDLLNDDDDTYKLNLEEEEYGNHFDTRIV